MAEIISILNRKGGVGKTTTTLNLGRALSLKKKKVLVIDNDGQANLTLSISGLSMQGKEDTLYDTYIHNKPLPIYEINEYFHAVPASAALDAVPTELGHHSGNIYRLKEAIDKVKSHYDFILIDSPPSTGILVYNAIAASTKYIITIKDADAHSLAGAKNLITLIHQELTLSGVTPKLLGMLITFYDSRRKIVSRMLEEEGKVLFDNMFFKTKITRLTALEEAASQGTDIFDWATNSESANEYRNLAEEVLALTEMSYV